MKRKLRAAVIGFGGIGHVHVAAYRGQPHVELVAVCDINPERFSQNDLDMNFGAAGRLETHELVQCLSYEELAARVDFDVLDICLPTYLHAEYSIRGMRDGYHVLCEKPMARTSVQARRMIRTAGQTKRKLMIAQCQRFSPAYEFLAKACQSGEYGKLLRLDFRRLSGYPSSEWFREYDKCGGTLLDMHVHDTDMVNYIFGMPRSVRTVAAARENCGFDDLMTTYLIGDGMAVTAEGSWCRGGWYCQTAAVFQKATLKITETSHDALEIFHPESGTSEKIHFRKSVTNNYFNEIRYFTECVSRNLEPTRCMPESTCDTMEIAEAEEKSACRQAAVRLFPGKKEKN